MASSNKPKGYSPKKLIARDRQDLDVFSALLQDAALTPADISYDKKARRFALTLNRFIQEERGFFKSKKGWRQRARLHFDHVSAVRQQGFSKEAEALALLSINTSSADDQDQITLIFSAGVSIELTLDSIDAYLTDFGDPWEALARPDHEGYSRK